MHSVMLPRLALDCRRTVLRIKHLPMVSDFVEQEVSLIRFLGQSCGSGGLACAMGTCTSISRECHSRPIWDVADGMQNNAKLLVHH